MGVNKTLIQALQMVFLRFGGIGVGALAQIYAARELGPEKLGISGMALTLVAQGSILANFGSDPLLVREYKEIKSEEEKKIFIQDAFYSRVLLVLLFAIIISVVQLVFPHPSLCIIATACVIPLVFFQSNQALWILQAEENMPAQYLASTAGNLLMAALIFLFIRSSSPAGSDLIASVAGVVLGFATSWYLAIRSLPKVHINFARITKILVRSKWLFLTAIVIYSYTKLEQPLLGMLRSVEELGIYRSALQITLGIQPFLLMFPTLLYPKLIAWKEKSLNHLWENQKRLFFLLITPILLISICTILIIPKIYSPMFGEEYKKASFPCAILVISQFIIVLNGIFAWGLWAAGKDKTMMGIMGVVGIISTTSNIIFIPCFGMIATASINLSSEILILIGCAYFMGRIAKQSQKETNDR